MEFILIFLLIIVISIIIWSIVTFNNINKADLKCNEALSDIDVALEKRHNVLLKMLNVCKQYVSYEQKTILKTIDLRTNSSLKQKNNNSDKLDDLHAYFNGLAENYPDLKADNNYIELQHAISDTEEHLSAARRAYNANVNKYNTYLVTFPSSIIATKINSNKKEFFRSPTNFKKDIDI